MIYETDFSILAGMPAEIQRNLVKPAAVTIVALAAGFLAAFWLESVARHSPVGPGLTRS
jgi:hypothetical protein